MHESDPYTPSSTSPPHGILNETLAAAAERMLEALRRTSANPSEGWSDLTFGEHALEVFRAQYAAVPAYRAWCDHELASRGIQVEDVRCWQHIPALPIAAFKRLRVAPDPSPQTNDDAEWWSSGTSGAGTSRHHVRSLALYDASLRYGLRRALLPDVDGPELLVVQLAPSSAAAPHSSLSHMLDAARNMCADGGSWVDGDFRVDASGAWEQLGRAAAEHQPVLVLATSFALVQLFDATADRPPLRLAARSRVMDTGGYKGRTREVTREDLLACIADRLGVPESMCENEYGMSELSSQAWLGSIAGSVGRPLDTPDGGRWQPPWMRTRVVHPATLEEVADGERGLLVHHDLANVWSCAAIRTEDLGVRRGASYELAGRAPGAQLRGCSLQLEDIVQ